MPERESHNLETPKDASHVFQEMGRAWTQFKNGKISHDELDQLVLRLESDSVELSVTNQPSPGLLWKQYELHVDLYKHLIDLILKFNGFYWVGTGAVLSFYISTSQKETVMDYVLLVPETSVDYVLLVPILGSIVLVPFFTGGVFLLNTTRRHIYNLSARLGLYIAPELNVLSALLACTAFMLILVAGCLLWFFLWNLVWLAALVLLLSTVLMWILFRKW